MKTTIQVGDDYMDFVYKMHQTMISQKLALVYEGEVNQMITKAFTSMAERKLDEEGEDSSKTRKRVYHVMVECLQNICKHADDPETGLPENPGSGLFIVGMDDDKYRVTTGNIVALDRVDSTLELLNKVNSLDPDELKEFYKKMMKESRLSEKAGAGLGFIDIVKKTGNKLIFHVEPVNDKTAFLVLSSDITRE